MSLRLWRIIVFSAIAASSKHISGTTFLQTASVLEFTMAAGSMEGVDVYMYVDHMSRDGSPLCSHQFSIAVAGAGAPVQMTNDCALLFSENIVWLRS